ncbi:hypothetical protein M1N69_03580, partial [Thermodesulfovibrionales bacterium]|nr:hypothetical protein [Thermodesulfovibrionales bacterium]
FTEKICVIGFWNLCNQITVIFYPQWRGIIFRGLSLSLIHAGIDEFDRRIGSRLGKRYLFNWQSHSR